MMAVFLKDMKSTDRSKEMLNLYVKAYASM